MASANFSRCARTGEILWRHRTRTPPNTSALTTGGGLAVVGDWDRYLYVHEATTGRILFQTRLPTSVQGFPITYAVNGKQYLAVFTGEGALTGGLIDQAQIQPTRRHNAVHVFALP